MPDEINSDHTVLPHKLTASDGPYLKVGTLLDNKYIIQRILGEGSSSITYLAFHKNLEQLRAIKEYFPTSIVNREDNNSSLTLYSKKNAESFDDGLKRFLAEAKRLAELKTHPNVIQVYELFEQNKTAYMVMEYEDGEAFADFLLQYPKKITQEYLSYFLRQVGAGLSHIHKANILHRDIKPANIYIRKKTMQPVLIDFGSARQKPTAQDEQLTAVFTASYAAPEQLITGSSDNTTTSNPLQEGPHTDIYGLAATLYYAISGAPPSTAQNRSAYLSMDHNQDSLIPLNNQGAHHLKQYTQVFLNAINEGLVFNWKKRPQTVDAWLTHFEHSEDKISKLTKDFDKTDQIQKTYKKRTDETRYPALRRFAILLGVFIIIGLLGFYGWESEKNSAKIETVKQQADPNTEFNPEKAIKILLAKAENRLKKGHLDAPKNNNALFYYQTILALDEGHQIAQAGLEKTQYEIDKQDRLNHKIQDIFDKTKKLEKQQTESINQKISLMLLYQKILGLDNNHAQAQSNLTQIANSIESDIDKLIGKLHLTIAKNHLLAIQKQGIPLAFHDEKIALIENKLNSYNKRKKREQLAEINQAPQRIKNQEKIEKFIHAFGTRDIALLRRVSSTSPEKFTSFEDMFNVAEKIKMEVLDINKNHTAATVKITELILKDNPNPVNLPAYKRLIKIRIRTDSQGRQKIYW